MTIRVLVVMVWCLVVEVGHPESEAENRNCARVPPPRGSVAGRARHPGLAWWLLDAVAVRN